jgi:hypothetical protein
LVSALHQLCKPQADDDTTRPGHKTGEEKSRAHEYSTDLMTSDKEEYCSHETDQQEALEKLAATEKEADFIVAGNQELDIFIYIYVYDIFVDVYTSRMDFKHFDRHNHQTIA